MTLLSQSGADSGAKANDGCTIQDILIDNKGFRTIKIPSMCPKCKSNKPGEIDFIRNDGDNWYAHSVKCPHCGFLFPRVKVDLKSIISFAIEWITDTSSSALGYYETRHCPQCRGLSAHGYVSTVQFRDPADDQFVYVRSCSICKWHD